MQTETNYTIVRTFKDPEFGTIDWIRYVDDQGYEVITYRIRNNEKNEDQGLTR